jgi:hypothetical protein
MKLIFSLLSVLLITLSCNSKKSSNNTSTRIGINTDGWSDSPFISRDGQRLYFMYSRWDFAPWIASGGISMPTLSGPDRPGLHHNNIHPFDESDIYMATRNPDGSWSEPVAMGFNGDYGDASGMEINNGNTFIWLRGNGSQSRIVMANKNSDGSWGSVVDLGNDINSPGMVQDNPHISPDGQALWFVSNRAGGTGGKDIYFSTKSSSEISAAWSIPINAGSPINTNGDEDQPWISPASMDVFWNGPSGVMHCVSNGSTCSSSPTVVTISGCDYVAEISMPDSGDVMYFACGNTSTFRVKIMYSGKQPNGTWGPATPID